LAATAALPFAASGRLDRFATRIAHFVPDAITASIVLVLMLVAIGLSLGNGPAQLVDAYYRGLWMLLPFTMQMALLIILSSALALTPVFRKIVVRLAMLPTSHIQVIALAALVNGVAAYCYWGLGYALGPVIAVCFAVQAERKDLAIDFPFFLATVTATQAVWQFGLSSSAPILMATPGHFLVATTGVIPLSKTIFTPAAIIQVVLFVACVIVAGRRLMPKNVRPISDYPESARLADPEPIDEREPETYSERIERSRIPAMILCCFFAAWLWRHFVVLGAGLELSALNTILFLLTFLFHGSVKNVTRAIEKSVRAAWPVIVLYHLYAGVAGIIQFTNIGERIAWLAASVSNARTYPALNAVISTVFAFFIPSSGGQWAIQGFVTVKSAMAVGVSVPRGMLSLGIGDHMGNFISPFWYVVTAGIVRLDFRRFFGYGLVFGVIWFLLGIVVMTFAPC
jgi:short-chain fatty acids transporter